jgi:hypothetical protein
VIEMTVTDDLRSGPDTVFGGHECRFRPSRTPHRQLSDLGTSPAKQGPLEEQGFPTIIRVRRVQKVVNDLGSFNDSEMRVSKLHDAVESILSRSCGNRCRDTAQFSAFLVTILENREGFDSRPSDLKSLTRDRGGPLA